MRTTTPGTAVRPARRPLRLPTVINGLLAAGNVVLVAILVDDALVALLRS